MLEHLQGARAGQREIYPIARFQTLFFGRGGDSDVRFNADLELMVSRSHAVIEWDQSTPRRFTLTDLVSSNGTFVNGHRLNGIMTLREGDEIQFGVSGPVIRFSVEQDQPQSGQREITQSMQKVEANVSSVAATLKRKMPSTKASG